MELMEKKFSVYRVLRYELKMYYNCVFGSISGLIKAILVNDPILEIIRWQINSRFADHFIWKSKRNKLYKPLQCFFMYRRNVLGMRIGIEINTMNIDEGLLLYHTSGSVINGSSIIGKNCRLHGNNCIGNAGPHDLRCPIIGDDVRLGVGAKVIGNVTIANGITIAAGAVVVRSFEEEGITIGGVPAKKLK